MITKDKIIVNQKEPAAPCSTLHELKGLTKLELVAAMCLQVSIAFVSKYMVKKYGFDEAVKRKYKL